MLNVTPTGNAHGPHRTSKAGALRPITCLGRARVVASFLVITTTLTTARSIGCHNEAPTSWLLAEVLREVGHKIDVIDLVLNGSPLGLDKNIGEVGARLSTFDPLISRQRPATISKALRV